jgi:hypothetical protein
MPTEAEKKAEAARLYRAWLAMPEPRPDFLDWAHTKRTATAA